MKKENKKQQEKRYKVKKNNDSMGKYIYSTILIFLGIAEGYFIVNNPEELLWIMILGVLLAVDSCLLISSIHVKQTKSTSGMYEFIFHDTEKELIQKVENIRKTEKAFYILSRKKFSEIDEKILRLEKAVVIISENVNRNKKSLENAFVQSMEDNRKVAKIIIAKNKENAEEYGSFQGDVVEKVELLEERLSKIEDTFLNLETLTDTKTDAEEKSVEDLESLESWEEFDSLFFNDEEEDGMSFPEESEVSGESKGNLDIDEIEALMASL